MKKRRIIIACLIVLCLAIVIGIFAKNKKQETETDSNNVIVNNIETITSDNQLNSNEEIFTPTFNGKENIEVTQFVDSYEGIASSTNSYVVTINNNSADDYYYNFTSIVNNSEDDLTNVYVSWEEENGYIYVDEENEFNFYDYESYENKLSELKNKGVEPQINFYKTLYYTEPVLDFFHAFPLQAETSKNVTLHTYTTDKDDLTTNIKFEVQPEKMGDDLFPEYFAFCSTFVTTEASPDNKCVMDSKEGGDMYVRVVDTIDGETAKGEVVKVKEVLADSDVEYSFDDNSSVLKITLPENKKYKILDYVEEGEPNDIRLKLFDDSIVTLHYIVRR